MEQEHEYVNVNDVPGVPQPRTMVGPVQVKEAWDGATAWAVVFAIASLGFALFGIVTLYGDSHIVGGDAYNYLISSTRGVAWRCVAIRGEEKGASDSAPF